MNSKENARRIIRFDHPERIMMNIPSHDISYFGVNHEPFEGVGGESAPGGSRWRDIWGVGWHKELPGIMGLAVEHPLADLNVERYAFPDPDDPRLVDPIYAKARNADRESCFISGSHRETLWERAYNLVGMERLMMAFYDAPDAVKELLHRITNFQMRIAEHYVKNGLEAAFTGDDLGTQISLLISKDIIQQFLVQEYRRLIDFYKRHGVIVIRHSCGHIEPILDVFMDLGVDVLNPIQATANNQQNIRRVTQGRMALAGGVSTEVIIAGPVARIRAETRKCMWVMGREGGYFCGPDQGMPFPEAHIQALRDTVEEYGRYPLQPPPEN